MLKTPVALIIFRRPELTARVLHAIAQAKPEKLLVVADGPRPGRPDDIDSCAAARRVIDRVDWSCEVLKNYSEVNLGCGHRPATGISWVFEKVEEAIILEDDCLPHPTFFRFCSELLERYRDDERVMHIAGSRYRPTEAQIAYSYHFSQFNGAWGWASWRRAWRYFDQTLRLWPELRDTSWLADIVQHERAVQYWAEEFEKAYQNEGDVSYWDHQWTFACWANSGLSIVPRVNLVSNLGCGPDATHTFWEDDPGGNVPTREMSFPLVHPPTVLSSSIQDREFLREIVLARLPAPPAPRSALRILASRVTPETVKCAYRKIRASSGKMPTRLAGRQS